MRSAGTVAADRCGLLHERRGAVLNMNFKKFSYALNRRCSRGLRAEFTAAPPGSAGCSGAPPSSSPACLAHSPVRTSPPACARRLQSGTTSGQLPDPRLPGRHAHAEPGVGVRRATMARIMSCSRRPAGSRSRVSADGGHRGGRPANRVAAVMTADGSRAGMLLARGCLRLMPPWCAWTPAVMTSSPPGPGDLRALAEAAGDLRRLYPVRAAWQPDPHDLCWGLVLGCAGSAMAAFPAWPDSGIFEH